ncbi:hypothetical protein ACH5RR_011562 [Cinchona calisaya]|uniref:VQ domain-containing protein n=1 Tax=Cinchona calisaya TaxID=153742 RepID=A0ABD3A597_9GENT
MEYSTDSYNCSSSTSSKFGACHPHVVEESRAKTFYSSLHAVRKLPLKPMKKPIAPLPPMKPKVYKVDSINFKQVVQRLTSAPEFQPNYHTQGAEEVAEKAPAGPGLGQRRLEEVAPPALDLSTTLLPDHFSSAGGNIDEIPANFSELIASERKNHKFSETCGAPSPLGFSFSPSSLAWCLSPLLSPGTLSFLD